MAMRASGYPKTHSRGFCEGRLRGLNGGGTIAVALKRSMDAWLSGRASPSHGGGHWFKSSSVHQTFKKAVLRTAFFLHAARHRCASSSRDPATSRTEVRVGRTIPRILRPSALLAPLYVRRVSRDALNKARDVPAHLEMGIRFDSSARTTVEVLWRTYVVFGCQPATRSV